MPREIKPEQYYEIPDTATTLRTVRVIECLDTMCLLKVLNNDLSETHFQYWRTKNFISDQGKLLIDENCVDYRVNPPQYIREQH